MHETGVQLLNLMFRDGESICVSHNKFGYHSVPLAEAKQGQATLVPKEESAAKRKLTVEEATDHVDSKNLLLCALNPINGFREDRFCTSFRSFLVEMDDGSLASQKQYIDTLGMPYSAIVFSGNKSLHFLISLDTDLPSEKVYRLFSRWILSIVTMADQKTLNPSRSIRIPGAEREADKFQKLLVINGQVKLDDLLTWLKKHPDAKPAAVDKRRKSEEGQIFRVKPWALKALKNGIDRTKGRNQQWFGIACEFAIAGYDEDETIDVLKGYYQEEYDFKEREWLVTVRSGFKSVNEGKIGK